YRTDRRVPEHQRDGGTHAAEPGEAAAGRTTQGSGSRPTALKPLIRPDSPNYRGEVGREEGTMNKTIVTEQDADQPLRAFFANEAPDPWPAFERPTRQVVLPFRPARKPRRFVLGSKLALAAAVALLTLCGWLLSGSFDGSPKGKAPLGNSNEG